jgi:Domain of unknown function (DUF4431)
VFIIGSSVTCATAYAQSYRYDAVVELKGILISSTADPSITIDEKPHQFPALQLHKPINVLCAPNEADCQPETGIRLLHLVLRAPQMAHFKKTKGKSISVRGTLFHSHTGHHFTSVLLDVESINP